MLVVFSYVQLVDVVIIYLIIWNVTKLIKHLRKWHCNGPYSKG